MTYWRIQNALAVVRLFLCNLDHVILHRYTVNNPAKLYTRHTFTRRGAVRLANRHNASIFHHNSAAWILACKGFVDTRGSDND